MHVAEIRLFQLKFEKYINFINKEGQFFTTRKTEGPQLSLFCWVCVLLRFYLWFYLYLSTHLLRTSRKYQNRDKYSKKIYRHRIFAPEQLFWILVTYIMCKLSEQKIEKNRHEIAWQMWRKWWQKKQISYGYSKGKAP